MNKTLNQEFIKKLKEEKNRFVPARTSILPKVKVDEILEKITKDFSLNTRDEAVSVLAALFQQGGTARGCDGNMSITMFDQSIKLADIRKILKHHSCNKSERKLARSLATEIFTISQILEITGNLYSKIQKQNLETEYLMDEKIWMSDFQSENPDCPTKIRTLILSTFEKKKDNKKKK